MSERPSQSLIESACMSYRHDFGLIPALAAAPIMVEAEAWLAAWRIGFEPYTSSPVFTGLGTGWVEPNAYVVDAACIAFDPGFRQRPFHEATTIRRGGVSWLQAWRHAFEDQPRKPVGLSSRTVPVDDHPQRPVIREPDEPSPVMVLIPLGLTASIRDCLKEVAEDLLSALAAAHGPEPRSESEQRRFDRNAEPAARAFRLVQAIDGQPFAYNPSWREARVRP